MWWLDKSVNSWLVVWFVSWRLVGVEALLLTQPCFRVCVCVVRAAAAGVHGVARRCSSGLGGLTLCTREGESAGKLVRRRAFLMRAADGGLLQGPAQCIVGHGVRGGSIWFPYLSLLLCLEVLCKE